MDNKLLSDEALNCLGCESIIEYLEKLKSLEHCLVIFAIKDTAGSCLNDSINKKLVELGLVKDLRKQFMVGYIAIIKDTVVIYEEKTEKGEQLEFKGNVDKWRLNVGSKPYNNGNLASICIDEIEYAVNYRGINIVVFDMQCEKVVDSVSFDTHAPTLTCYRKKGLLDISEKIRVDIKDLNNKLELVERKMEGLSEHELKLLFSTTLYDYLKNLKQLNTCTIIFSVKDTAGTYFDKIAYEEMRKLGLTQSLVNKWQAGYIAIIFNQKIVYEVLSEKNGEEEYSIVLDNVLYEIISSSYNKQNKASIKINRKEYSVNNRGLNIVVYNNLTKCVIDSVSFDTHDKKIICRRKQIERDKFADLQYKIETIYRIITNQ